MREAIVHIVESDNDQRAICTGELVSSDSTKKAHTIRQCQECWRVGILRQLKVIPDERLERMTLQHNHNPVQHRDGKEPWCNFCELTASGYKPKDAHKNTVKSNHPKARDLQFEAKMHVVNYFNLYSEKTDNYVLSIDKVYVTWFAKTLQNWKAMVSTEIPDGMYYEVTHNGDKKETYIDAYKKFKNVCVAEPESQDKDDDA